MTGCVLARWARGGAGGWVDVGVRYAAQFDSDGAGTHENTHQQYTCGSCGPRSLLPDSRFLFCL